MKKQSLRFFYLNKSLSKKDLRTPCAENAPFCKDTLTVFWDNTGRQKSELIRECATEPSPRPCVEKSENFNESKSCSASCDARIAGNMCNNQILPVQAKFLPLDGFSQYRKSFKKC